MSAFSLGYKVINGNTLSGSDFLDLCLICFRVSKDQWAPF